jgi:hypothetical protein
MDIDLRPPKRMRHCDALQVVLPSSSLSLLRVGMAARGACVPGAASQASDSPAPPPTFHSPPPLVPPASWPVPPMRDYQSHVVAIASWSVESESPSPNPTPQRRFI